MRKPFTKAGVISAGIVSLLVFFLANRAAYSVLCADGAWILNLSPALSGLAGAIADRPFFISLASPAVIAGSVCALLVWLVYLYRVAGLGNYMPGEEHGTAKWGRPKDIKPLTNKIPELNIPLSATEQISLPELTDFEFNRNKNIALVGGSGSGKTYGVYFPSLMQLHSSYVITDPNGYV